MLVLNKNKIIKILISIVILINIFAIKVAAIVKPTSDFYVNDYAKLLNSNTQNYIININKKLYDLTGAQIVVVTVLNLEGDSLEEYATELFRNFGIGDKNNGVLLLLALEEREFRVEVGYGLEGCLNDAKTGRIQDEYIIPYLKNNQWDEGIRNGFNAILEEISAEYGVSIEHAEGANIVEQPNANLENPNNFFILALIIFIIPFVLGFLTKCFGRKFAMIYGTYFFGMMLFLKFIWVSMSSFLILFIWSSMVAFFLGIFGEFFSGGNSFSSGSSSRSGFSSGGGGSSGGGRKFEKILIFEIIQNHSMVSFFIKNYCFTFHFTI